LVRRAATAVVTILAAVALPQLAVAKSLLVATLADAVLLQLVAAKSLLATLAVATVDVAAARADADS
jgi:hypothetical protein